MLTWSQTEKNLRAAGCSEQSIASSRLAHLKRCRRAAVEAKQKTLEEAYERYRRANLLDYFEQLEDEQAEGLAV